MYDALRPVAGLVQVLKDPSKSQFSFGPFQTTRPGALLGLGLTCSNEPSKMNVFLFTRQSFAAPAREHVREIAVSHIWPGTGSLGLAGMVIKPSGNHGLSVAIEGWRDSKARWILIWVNRSHQTYVATLGGSLGGESPCCTSLGVAIICPRSSAHLCC